MLDARDTEILAHRMAQLNEREGPRVGDWVILQGDGDFNERLRRFTHDWGDTIQTNDPGDSGSFYLGDGYCSYSGALAPGIDKKSLTNSGQTRLGRVWFFRHNIHEAHNRVNTAAEFRVFLQANG